MRDPESHRGVNLTATHRRDFLKSVTALGLGLTIPLPVTAGLSRMTRPVKLGIISDLHQDIIHDAGDRLQAFLDSMKQQKPDAIMQLGDFACPIEKNQPLLDAFRMAHPHALHVLGNHEVDAGHSLDEVAEMWEMPGRYYRHSLPGLEVIILDGNEKPADHQSGYPAYLGNKQLKWLRSTLQEAQGAVMVFCHQPLAGPGRVDNARAVQAILNEHADKVLLTVNGHTHVDHVVRAEKIVNLHVNSASYFWVGSKYANKSYPEAIHESNPVIQYTCPYRRSLFTTLTIDPEQRRVHVRGCESEWVGQSPSELGYDSWAGMTDGEEICPKIRERDLRPPR